MSRCGVSLFAFCLATSTALVAPAAAQTAQCKPKTAGFFQQFREFSTPRLSVALQSLPQSLTGQPGNAGNGRAVFSDPQKGDCVSCHRVTSLSGTQQQGALGPTLDGVAAKYSDAQLRLWLVNPKAYAPKTIMPSYHKVGGQPGQSVLAATEVEDLIAYMKTLN
jgi:sulfur-oxidizing protein SoxX